MGCTSSATPTQAVVPHARAATCSHAAPPHDGIAGATVGELGASGALALSQDSLVSASGLHLAVGDTSPPKLRGHGPKYSDSTMHSQLSADVASPRPVIRPPALDLGATSNMSTGSSPHKWIGATMWVASPTQEDAAARRLAARSPAAARYMAMQELRAVRFNRSASVDTSRSAGSRASGIMSPHGSARSGLDGAGIHGSLRAPSVTSLHSMHAQPPNIGWSPQSRHFHSPHGVGAGKEVDSDGSDSDGSDTDFCSDSSSEAELRGESGFFVHNPAPLYFGEGESILYSHHAYTMPTSPHHPDNLGMETQYMHRPESAPVGDADYVQPRSPSVVSTM